MSKTEGLVPYIGSKIIQAKPMSHIDFLTKIQDEDVPTDQVDEAGYLVVYPPNNYRSWSPKAVFDIAYRRITKAEMRMTDINFK